MNRATLGFLVAGCYPGALLPPEAPPTRFDAPGCHVLLLPGPPQGAVNVGRVRVFADLEHFGEDWALQTLAANACAYGGNALVLRTEREAIPPRLARYLQLTFETVEADAFKVR